MDKVPRAILVVEDDQFLREFYQELLTGEGYRVDVAPDGEVASAKIKEGGYDLVLLDIMLPKKDGIQVLREHKLSPSKNPVKMIVMLTNLGHDAVIEQCFQLGAKGFLIKSAMNPDQVLTEISNYLKNG